MKYMSDGRDGSDGSTRILVLSGRPEGSSTGVHYFAPNFQYSRPLKRPLNFDCKSQGL